MNFASPYVFNNAAESDLYDVVSDEEFSQGMNLSDSSSDEEYADGQTGSPPPPPPPPPLPRSSLQGQSCNNEMTTVHCDHVSQCSSEPPVRPAALHQQKSSSSRMHHWKSDKSDPISKGAGKKGKRRVFRRADTNVVSIRFDTLKTPSAMHAGEVIMCTGCEAIMSHISCIEEDGPDKIWKCEFCGNRNMVEIEEEEKPTADDVTYLVEPALSTAAIGTSGRDESIVIFCIDTSGSMTITTEVPGHQKLRGSETLRRLRRENTMEGPQRLPSESRIVTHVSRLQAVQAAVDHQLGEMAREFPHRRVGLVSFSYEVKVVGDGTGEEVTVSGQKLTNKEELTQVGTDLACPKAIRETRASLGEKIFGLEEGGATALGPALIVALGMASHHPGSRVVICTDGKSNEGVGKVENLVDTDPNPDEFYESIAAEASAKGVSISVITISGTDCKLIQLGKLADRTGGQVNIVDPLKLTEVFTNVLADRIIATSVVATFILHRGLYIGKEENEASKERREVGNVRSDHEISFEYGVRKAKPKVSKEEPNANLFDHISEVSTSMEENPPSFRKSDSPLAEGGVETQPAASAGGSTADVGGSGDESDIPSELPFQLQITYTDVDGTKALRVLTQKKPVTSDRNLAEKDADLSVLGVHTERKVSELALEGDYSGSRGVALMTHRLGWRSSRSSEDSSRKKMYHQAFSRVKEMENRVQAKQRQEISLYGRTHSDDEDEGEDEKVLYLSGDMVPCAANQLSSASRARRKEVLKVRSEEQEDDMARVMYQSHSSSTAHIKPKLPPKPE